MTNGHSKQNSCTQDTRVITIIHLLRAVHDIFLKINFNIYADSVQMNLAKAKKEKNAH